MKVNSTPPQTPTTFSCSFCGETYTPKRVSNYDAKYRCCGKKECMRARERQHSIDRREAMVGQSWVDNFESFKPGELIAEVNAKIIGGRFRSDGGAQITLVVNKDHKYRLMDITDFANVKLDVIFRRPLKDDDD